MRLSYDPEKIKIQRRKEIRDKFARHILLVLAVTAGVGAFILSPYGLHFLVRGAIRYYFRDRKRFQTELAKLRKKGFIAVAKKNDRYTVKLLKKGLWKIKKLQLEQLQLSKDKHWDGKWRIYIFDIPEDAKLARDALTRKLKELGMLHVQRSVFIYPFDCRNELQFIADCYGVEKYTSFGELIHTDLDVELRRYYREII